MTISFLNEEEIKQVVSIIDQILLTKKFECIIKDKVLIMVQNKRKHIFLVDKTDKRYISTFSEENCGNGCKPVFFKINLGFWIQNRFRIGIESLPFLAQFCENPIIINSKRQVTRFIYGKNVDIILNENIKDKICYTDESLVIVSSKNHIPLGYAKMKLEKDKLHLKNVIDIGIYQRSEKSAF